MDPPPDDPAALAVARLKAEGRTSRGVTRKGVLLGALVFARYEPISLASGAALLAGAMALRLASKGCLRRTRRVVTGGPYAFLRHPFYLGNLMADAALLAVAGLPLAIPFYTVLFWLAYRGTMAGEERMLGELHGEAYGRYRAAVPGLLPRLLPWRTREPAPFSFGMALAEREVSRSLRLAAYPLLLLLRLALLPGLAGGEPFAPGRPAEWILGGGAAALLLASRWVHGIEVQRGPGPV